MHFVASGDLAETRFDVFWKCLYDTSQTLVTIIVVKVWLQSLWAGFSIIYDISQRLHDILVTVLLNHKCERPKIKINLCHVVTNKWPLKLIDCHGNGKTIFDDKLVFDIFGFSK